MSRRFVPQRRVVWGAAIAGIAAVFFVAGFAIQAALSDTSSTATPPAAATTDTPQPETPTAAATSSATPSPSADTPEPTTPTSSRPTIAPRLAPSATPDSSIQPSVRATSLDPPLGAHIEQDSVNIAIGVDYQAGSVSNVLSWYIRYCASPNDCNTFGSRVGAVDVIPGSSGRVTLGGVFPAGGNYLRPIVICQYTVEIGHFVTPEAQWQSDNSSDPRCHPEVLGPTVVITDVTPPLGTALHAGNTIAVNVRYDAVSADTLTVYYDVEGCIPQPATKVAITPGTSNVATVLIPVTAAGAGTLELIVADLLVGGRLLISYDFGDCPTSPP